MAQKQNIDNCKTVPSNDINIHNFGKISILTNIWWNCDGFTRLEIKGIFKDISQFSAI